MEEKGKSNCLRWILNPWPVVFPSGALITELPSSGVSLTESDRSAFRVPVCKSEDCEFDNHLSLIVSLYLRWQTLLVFSREQVASTAGRIEFKLPFMLARLLDCWTMH